MTTQSNNTFNWYDFNGISGHGSGRASGSDSKNGLVTRDDATDTKLGTTVTTNLMGNNVDYGTDENDTIQTYGGEGYDQVVFQGGSADYMFARNSDGSLSAASDQGMNLLMNIKSVFFEETEEWAATKDLA